MIPICPVVSFTYGESNVAREVSALSLLWPGAAGRRGGWGWLRGGGGGRHRGVRGSEGVLGGRRTAARPRPGRPGRLLTAPLSLPFPPSASRSLRFFPPAMGPDSPCPPQCPAGWGKMPKWRPATTLDSPTAGRRRRRLRPSIGNGSPLPSFSPPPRPWARIPPTRRPRGRSRASPHPAAPSPGLQQAQQGPAALRARPAPARPARTAAGSRPRWGRGGRDSRGLGTWRAAGAFGGPGVKMASCGLGAEPSRPPPPSGRPPVPASASPAPTLIVLSLGRWRGDGKDL